MAMAATSPVNSYAARSRNREAAQAVVQKRLGGRELAFLLFWGALLRFAAMLAVIRMHPPTWLFTRVSEMNLMAISILNGKGLSSPFGGQTGPTALIGPVYPLMVAAIFKLAGSGSLASEVIVIGLQVGVGLLNLWLLVRLTERLAGRQTAFLTGFFWACSPAAIAMPLIFWDTTFTAAALTAMSVYVLSCRARVRTMQLFCTGAAFALAALLNNALFFTAIALLALLARGLSHARLKSFALALVLFLSIFSVWPIRNALAFHAFVPFRTTIGLELWMGNHQGSTGHVEEELFPTFNANELSEYKTLGEVGYDRAKKHLAIDYIRTHPRIFVLLSAQRFVRFWLGNGSRNQSLCLTVFAAATSALGLVGIAAFIRARGIESALPFVVPLILFPLPYYITHAEFRYRLVVDPLLTTFAFYGLWIWVQHLRTKHQAAQGMEGVR